MSIDIKIDTTTGAMVPGETVTGRDLVLQRLWVRLNLGLGELLADASKGVPWVRWASTRTVPLAEVVTVIRREIETAAGVAKIEALSATRRGGDVVVSASLTLSDGSEARVGFTTTAAARDTREQQIAPVLIMSGL